MNDNVYSIDDRRRLKQEQKREEDARATQENVKKYITNILNDNGVTLKNVTVKDGNADSNSGEIIIAYEKGDPKDEA